MLFLFFGTKRKPQAVDSQFYAFANISSAALLGIVIVDP